MILSKAAIKKAIAVGQLKVEPLNERDIEAAHVNLHLELDEGAKMLYLEPKAFITAKTIEHITLSDKLCGFIEGKASLAKLGVSIEQSSTFIEPGSDHKMTLEIFNASDNSVRLTTGQPIAKLLLTKVTDDL